MTLFHHTIWQGPEEQSNRSSVPTVASPHPVVYGRVTKSGRPQFDSYHHVYHWSTVAAAQATVAVAVANLTTQELLRNFFGWDGLTTAQIATVISRPRFSQARVVAGGRTHLLLQLR